nr:phosphoribosylformylglycinamidine synthase [Desulfobulbaceae bacterium]
MSQTVQQLYRKISDSFEYCFNIESHHPLKPNEIQQLMELLADGFIASTVTATSSLHGGTIVELGPRLNFATAWSSNMVSICSAIGLEGITRVERSRRYLVDESVSINTFVHDNHDRMTECRYNEPLKTFDTGIVPEKVYDVPMMENGPDALASIPGISMDEWDRNFYYDYFVKKHNRNPTIVEIMDLNNANSEHSRHSFFRGIQVIDGVEQPENLMQVVISTLKANPDNSVIAFKDNSSGITGRSISTIIPKSPGQTSPLVPTTATYDLIFTAETHNFPTGVAPFPGAETGTGGRIRDVQGTGQGGFVVAGTTGYCVANLHINGYELPWETPLECPSNLASALKIEIEASNGASDYGNKFGEPLIQGFTRSFDMRLDDGQRWGFLKPIMFTGGIGQIDHRHIKKSAEEKDMYIIQVGGPAYRVGFGGGAASSMLQGENAEELDFNAVQRGDAEMEQKMNRVIRACNEMGEHSLIDVIHDQGAGGPANVLKELVEKSGGQINIRNIKAGDPTMSVLEIYVAEFQERNGFLVRPENLDKFKAICSREKVNCEVLGQVTGDLRFIVRDEFDNSTPVDLELSEVLGNVPTKTFKDNRIPTALSKVAIPADTTLQSALDRVLKLVSVGSKRFLTNKVDRSVTGLIAQQQCCGPLQATVSDVAVIAQSHFGKSGAACAIGEQPIKMLSNPSAGARMAVGESVTNIMWAAIDGINSIKCSANWMWAPKLAGEGSALYDAACAMRDSMIALGVAVDGGKDSLSMATRVGNETVKSPRELVISVYSTMEDITQVVTPDIKQAGASLLYFIDLADGKNRLGGSALAQVFNQVGSDTPDMENPALLKQSFATVQNLIRNKLICSGHDRSDGGLITTVLEMAFSGNCGITLDVSSSTSLINYFFSEELGLVFEVRSTDTLKVESILKEADIPFAVLGSTTSTKEIAITFNGDPVLTGSMLDLRQIWEETSYQLEKLQMNPACANEEKKILYNRKGPQYSVPFTPAFSSPQIVDNSTKPKVAILRDEGSNSDREMSSAFFAAGFEPWDITMSDLLNGDINLDGFRGLAAVGGFSYADVPESAKGWAATIVFNEKLKQMFTKFYNDPNTFSLGICNGCQLFGLLGWVPWRGISPEIQPRFIQNNSRRFESRWSTVKILPNKSIMLQGMEGLTFGIHVAHGEGKLSFPDPTIFKQVKDQQLAALAFVDDDGVQTEQYPFNPNGSPEGITGLCTADGRHLAMMPHPERSFLNWQAHWLPPNYDSSETASPWLKMFQNAYEWCLK